MNFLLHIIISICHWLPTVLGYNLVFGKGKIFHFGPLGTSLATAYPIFLTVTGRMCVPEWARQAVPLQCLPSDNYLLAIVVGAMFVTVVSLMYAWLSLRLEPDALGVMSIAMHLMMLSIILNWTSLTRGPLGIRGIPRISGIGSLEVFTLVTFIVAVFYVLLFLWIDRSPFGRKLSALAEHPWHAGSMGINRTLIHIGAFLLLGLGHLAGNLFFPQYIYLLHPNDFQFPAFIFIIMVVVAGKPGSVLGVTLATILITLLKEGIDFVPLDPSIVGPGRLILFGLILFIAVWIRRDTLFPQERKI